MPTIRKREHPRLKHAAEKFFRQRLSLSGITPEQARHAGIKANLRDTSGVPLPSYCVDGFLIPYYDAGGKLIRNVLEKHKVGWKE
jgi:hypothetical protein